MLHRRLSFKQEFVLILAITMWFLINQLREETEEIRIRGTIQIDQVELPHKTIREKRAWKPVTSCVYWSCAARSTWDAMCSCYWQTLTSSSHLHIRRRSLLAILTTRRFSPVAFVLAVEPLWEMIEM